MAEVIQANYEVLGDIANIFLDEAEKHEALLARLESRADTLISEGWIGEGADAFFAEMDDAVFPRLRRMVDALYEANRTTLHIIETMMEAEEDAAQLFQQGAGVGATAGAGVGAKAGVKPSVPKTPSQQQVSDTIDLLQKSPAGQSLLKQAESAGMRLEADGQFVGGDPKGEVVNIAFGKMDGAGKNGTNTLGGYNPTTKSITLDNHDFPNAKQAGPTLAHEVQHALDYKEGRASRIYKAPADMPKDALDKKNIDTVAKNIQQDVQTRAKTEVRAHHRGDAVKGGTGYTLKEPLTENDVQAFFGSHDHYRKNYEKYYTSLIRQQTGDPDAVVKIAKNGTVTIQP